MINKTILHYKILSKLGEGGMGVVYKAEDTKLKREVAIKFLPRQITASDEERERFKIEAQAAAALNHNNIATIFAIEESDEETFIVMEYIAGQELKDKIDSGPLPIDDTLNLAIQIARGLQAAHTKEVIHRDIKSANIMLTAEGDVKIMDFGLAKLGGHSKLTKEGTTLGTVAYMSPEQTRGDDVDQRSDIFSLGVLLYEMLTGQVPFKGDYDQAVTYSILNEQPEPVTGLRTGIPMELERIVGKCLEKEASDRYQHADELVVDLRKLKKESETKEILSKTGVTSVQHERTKSASAATEAKTAGSSKVKGFALAAVGLMGLISLVAYFLLGRESQPIRLLNPTKITQAIGYEDTPTWSFEGDRIAYKSNQGGPQDIWLKQISGGEPINMTKDIAAACLWPSLSPDGSQIAFSSQGSIWTMPAIGGPATRVAPISRTTNPVWSADGTRLAFMRRDSTGLPGAVIYTLATHEEKRVALPGDQFERTYLSWSPDGDYFAYADADNFYFLADVSTIRIVRIADGTNYQISNEGHLEFFPSWSRDGRLLYFISDRGGTTDLWQVRLSAAGKPDENPEQISHGLELESYAFSPDFTRIAFSKVTRVKNTWRISIPLQGASESKWADAQQLTFESSTNHSLDLSPDGKRIYFSSDRSGNLGLWSMSTSGGSLRPLATAPEDNGSVAVSPDGSTLAYVSERTGKREIWTMPAGGGPSTQITSDQSPKYWPRWSPDGRTIAFEASDKDSQLDLWIVPAQGGETKKITQSGFVFYPLWWPDGQSLLTVGRVGHYGLWQFPIDNGDPVPLTAAGFIMAPDDLRWSVDKTQIYFIKRSGGIRNIWSLSVADGSVRQLTDFSGRYGSLGRDLVTDGSYFYFNWEEVQGDIWVSDVERD